MGIPSYSVLLAQLRRQIHKIHKIHRIHRTTPHLGPQVATPQRGANGIELLGVGPQDGGHHPWHHPYVEKR